MERINQGHDSQCADRRIFIAYIDQCCLENVGCGESVLLWINNQLEAVGA